VSNDIDIADLFNRRSASKPKQPEPAPPPETETVSTETRSAAPETVSAEPWPESASAALTAPARPRPTNKGGRPMGRPTSPVGERWVDTNRRAAFYLSTDLIEAIDRASAEQGITKSDLVRRAVDAWLDSHTTS
jgi:hypothetical protein